MGDPWTLFRGALTPCFAAVLLLALLFTMFRRPDPRLRRLSTVRVVSAAFSGCLGFGYLFLGAWRLVENLRKLHSLLPVDLWFPTLFQGVVWAAVGVMVSVRAPVRWLSVLAFLFALFVSGLLLFTEGHLALDVAFGVLSLPGAVLLLLCAYLDDTTESGLYAPLNGQAGVPDKDESGTTKFAGAGLCNTLSFWWLNSMMKAGREKTLTEEDMPKLREADRAERCYLLYTEEVEKLKRKNPSSQPSMLWVIICCHWRDIFLSGFFALLKIITLSAGPLLLNAFILVSEGQQSFQYEGYVLAFTLFVAKNIESLSQRQWYFRSRLVGLKVRSLLRAAIYKKQLRLSNSAKLKHSSGEIMNYFIVDAYRIGEFPFWFHQTWTTLLQLCIALVILFRAVGLATLASLAAIVISVLCNAPLAKLQHKFQTKLMTAQDERLKATSEALANMKVLKLYAWEKHFKCVVETLRKAEEKWLSAVQLRKAYSWFLFWLSPLLVSAATFGACYFLKVPLQANNVFTFVATLRLVQDPIRSISDVLAVVIQAKVAFSRIARFLDAPELESLTVRLKGNLGSIEKPITIKLANFSWEKCLSKSTLRNINLEIGLVITG